MGRKSTMFKQTNTYFYRTLTKTEQESMEAAILWLAKHHVKPHQIAFLTRDNIDRELNAIAIIIPGKRFTIVRKIGYQGTAMERYLTDTFPGLKSRDWLFPTSVWTGVRPSFGFHVRVEGVENFVKQNRKMVLNKLRQYSIIEVSIKGLHIQNQQTVGRR